MDMLCYYIASKLENAPRVRELKSVLDGMGWRHTYDWTKHGSVQKCDTSVIRKVAHAETSGVELADVLIVLLPGGRGTHCELGMAIAGEQEIFVLSETPEVDFGTGGETCAFYHHSRVNQVSSWNELLETLKAYDQGNFPLNNG